MRLVDRRFGFRNRAFALVLSLMLVAMLATTGVGLGLLASTEVVRSRSASHALDHRLAVDSLLTFLHKLLEGESDRHHSGTADAAIHIVLQVGTVRVECFAHPEEAKMRISDGAGGNRILPRLRELAVSNGLSEQSVVLRPIVESDATRDWPSYLWFDQLIAPTTFEQTFRWRHSPMQGRDARRHKTWSDLLTFWNTSSRALSLEITTSIQKDIRRWYVVVDLAGDEVRVLYKGMI